ncbi:MAG: DUF1499 domain-containing protein [Rhizobiaceae bacterium]|nr:DUF1499 domain-containing protein [Rhizobiaceae bacterium]
MTATIERPMSPGAVWSRRLGIFSVVLLVTIWFGHRYGFFGTSELLPLLVAVFLFAGAGLIFGLIAYRRFWYYGDRGGAHIFWGIFWSLIALAPFAVAGWWYLSYPALHDISTDPQDPPSLARAGRARSIDMNPIAPPGADEIAAQLEAYPLIVGRRYDVPHDRVLAAVEDMIKRRGWPVVSTTDLVGALSQTTVEASAHSTLWRLPADVAVRLTDEDTATFVDMRSASRYGRHDLGENAARIGDFLAELDTIMAAQTPVTSGRAPSGEDDDVSTPADGTEDTPTR